MIPMHRWYKRKRHRWLLGKGWWESTGRPGLVSYPQVFLPWAPMGQSSTSFCRTEESFWIIIREKWGEGDLTPSHGAYFAKLQRGRHTWRTTLPFGNYIFVHSFSFEHFSPAIFWLPSSKSPKEIEISACIFGFRISRLSGINVSSIDWCQTKRL